MCRMRKSYGWTVGGCCNVWVLHRRRGFQVIVVHGVAKHWMANASYEIVLEGSHDQVSRYKNTGKNEREAMTSHLLGALQSTQKLLPFALRMACRTTASLWLFLRACNK